MDDQIPGCFPSRLRDCQLVCEIALWTGMHICSVGGMLVHICSRQPALHVQSRGLPYKSCSSSKTSRTRDKPRVGRALMSTVNASLSKAHVLGPSTGAAGLWQVLEAWWEPRGEAERSGIIHLCAFRVSIGRPLSLQRLAGGQALCCRSADLASTQAHLTCTWRLSCRHSDFQHPRSRSPPMDVTCTGDWCMNMDPQCSKRPPGTWEYPTWEYGKENSNSIVRDTTIKFRPAILWNY